MAFFGSIRTPLLMNIVVGVISLKYLTYSWPKVLKLTFIIIVIEGLRGFFGHIVFENFVVNDGWHFWTWTDLIFHFFGFMLVVVFGFSSGLRLRKIISFLTFSGFLLAVWALTHVGVGPGGYLGDENDNCLVLVSLIPISFVYLISGASRLKIIFGYVTAFLLVLAVVATQSRGGFIGFAMVVFFQFWYSPRKVRWILGAFFLGVCSLPFIPEKYYKEIKSIGVESQAGTGTIQERLDTWSYIYKMWKDPRNMFTGVGLENSKWRLHEYEDLERGVTLKSLAGRASHSMYFQLLGDMGLWGVFMIGGIIFSSIQSLRKIIREIKQIKNIDSVIVYKEFIFIQGFARAILCSWLGVLGAAVGISVLYYPTIWFLAALSASLFLYYQKLSRLVYLEFKDKGSV